MECSSFKCIVTEILLLPRGWPIRSQSKIFFFQSHFLFLLKIIHEAWSQQKICLTFKPQINLGKYTVDEFWKTTLLNLSQSKDLHQWKWRVLGQTFLASAAVRWYSSIFTYFLETKFQVFCSWDLLQSYVCDFSVANYLTHDSPSEQLKNFYMINYSNSYSIYCCFHWS